MAKPVKVAVPAAKVGATGASKAVWPLAGDAAARLANDRFDPFEALDPKFSAVLPFLSLAAMVTLKPAPERTSPTADSDTVLKVTLKALLVAEMVPAALAMKV